jgi:hypothetical protein
MMLTRWLDLLSPRYDASVDKWMMNNLFNTTAPSKLTALHTALHKLAACAGRATPARDPG